MMPGRAQVAENKLVKKITPGHARKKREQFSDALSVYNLK
jgi:hypothetical protein